MPRSPAQNAITEARYQRFVEIFRISGPELTIPEIAASLGVSTASVDRYRRKLGIPKAAPHKGFPSKLDADPTARDWLRANYASVSNKEIAARFGVSIGAVQTWRRRLGVVKGHEGKWSRAKHPRGFLGGKHTPEAKRVMLEAVKRAYLDPNSKFHLPELRQKRSDAMTRWQAINKTGGYSRCAGGKRPDLGENYFRSSWEANYARYLNWRKGRGEIFDWAYEADTFWFHKILRGTRSYKPDFKVWDREGAEPHYVEVKGWMDQKSKTKLARMAKYYPDIRVELFGAKDYRGLKNLAPVIPGWEYDSTIRVGPKFLPPPPKPKQGRIRVVVEGVA